MKIATTNTVIKNPVRAKYQTTLPFFFVLAIRRDPFFVRRDPFFVRRDPFFEGIN